ncbi:protein naked cuticle homolog 2 isoform X3 [Peromyscus californicus insignis]|uniref:protein naked cuticle homolog 2 isoform X3 n=1 Tax=Peromyscus californicus insignis TaxID=564181 RepID=UPI0022A6DB52|nr:protein naked cuticle homolog 2 isoform X3 [Peromyscus californicus insignis]
MGKFQSKHAAAACKRRESPEGDSFVVSAYASGRKGAEETDRRAGGVMEHRARDKQELPNGDPKEGPFWEDKGSLEVVLPPEKSEGHEGQGQLFSMDDGERAAGHEGPLRASKKHLNIDALQCDVSVEEDNRQEWTFTLYDFDNSGKVTREDMSSLMHTIYEVVDASVNHSSGSSKTLRVKLTVSPEPSSKRKECPPPGQDRESTRGRTESELTEDPRVADRRLSAYSRKPNADSQTCSVRVPYCVDENTERRNHYLDLAGIENYTSKFGPGPRSWLTMSYQLMSLLSGPWLRSLGSRGRRSSSSGLPRAQENLLGHQAAANQGKRSTIACRPSRCPRVLRMATTFRSPHHSPHHSPMVTSGTGRRAEKATHHSRDMASLPWWSMKWYGTCLPC